MEWKQDPFEVLGKIPIRLETFLVEWKHMKSNPDVLGVESLKPS